MDWFKFYPGRFLLGSSHLSAEEAGCYIRLLCAQAIKGGLPDDLSRLSHMAGGMSADAWQTISEKFPVGDDGLRRNPRLQQVTDDARAATETARENGRKGGRAKAAKGGSGKATRVATPDATPDGLQKERGEEIEREIQREVDTDMLHGMPALNMDDMEREKIEWAGYLTSTFGVDRVISLRAVQQTWLKHESHQEARSWIRGAVERSITKKEPKPYLYGILRKEYGLR